MSYETRRMAQRIAERRSVADPTATAGDHLGRALAARHPDQAGSGAPARAGAAAPSAPASPATKAWAQSFYEAARTTNVPLGTLTAIVAVCDSQDEAMRHLSARIDRPTAITPSHAGDEAAAGRILAAHAKAHQPSARTKRR